MAERTYYTYPIVRTDDYVFTAQYKIYLALGRYPDETRFSEDNTQYLVGFDIPLLAADKTKLDAIFADPNTVLSIPSSPTVFNIIDIWERFQVLVDTIGIVGAKCTIWFSRSSPTVTHYDNVELHFDRVLSVQEEKKVLGGYAAMITKKVV